MSNRRGTVVPGGYDTGKRIKGRKRHLLVDTLGLVLGMVVTPGHTTERALARDAGLEVEFIPRKNFRQEDRIAEWLARRGAQPGRGQVFAAMEPGPAFRPWPDQPSRPTDVKITQGK